MNNINEALDYDGLKYYHKKLKNMLSMAAQILPLWKSLIQ